MRVFLHVWNPEAGEWESEPHQFKQVPAVGDHVALDAHSPYWYRVRLVVHAAYHADYDAAVFVTQVNQRDAVEEAER